MTILQTKLLNWHYPLILFSLSFWLLARFFLFKLRLFIYHKQLSKFICCKQLLRLADIFIWKSIKSLTKEEKIKVVLRLRSL
ncbi:unnamed protein product [Blepharisma stoltei]|uniref:ATP synthase F0 subunit 8 n=1 Tax=Blepharisma stoltei TaxID=1481888 RepID=A0AAU9IPX4_9CILI|nr:unnamed protein product [Blepharisma stoltei]